MYLATAINNNHSFLLILSLIEMHYQRELFLLLNRINMDRKHKSNIIQPTSQQNQHAASYESAHQNNQPHQLISNLQYSTVKKVSQFGPQSQTPSLKPVRLKVHMKTQMQTTPKLTKQKEFITSRKKKINWNDRSPLAAKDYNAATHERKNKTMITQFYTIDEEIQRMEKKLSILSEVLPQPKKPSLLYSRLHKQSFIDRLKQEEKPTPSKSKKKISFTVYEEKEKSRNKSVSKVSPVKPLKKQYLVPYRYNSTITINLFDARSSRSKSKVSKSISLGRIQTKERSLSLPKRQSVSKSIANTSVNPQNVQKINKTLQTLKSYKFVEEYIQKSQILQKIQGYILKDEPSCKWALLIVDQVFSKIRSESNFEKMIASK